MNEQYIAVAEEVERLPSLLRLCVQVCRDEKSKA
jgi:hypothetical protein